MRTLEITGRLVEAVTASDGMLGFSLLCLVGCFLMYQCSSAWFVNVRGMCASLKYWEPSGIFYLGVRLLLANTDSTESVRSG